MIGHSRNYWWRRAIVTIALLAAAHSVAQAQGEAHIPQPGDTPYQATIILKDGGQVVAGMDRRDPR